MTECSMLAYYSSRKEEPNLVDHYKSDEDLCGGCNCDISEENTNIGIYSCVNIKTKEEITLCQDCWDDNVDPDLIDEDAESESEEESEAICENCGKAGVLFTLKPRGGGFCYHYCSNCAHPNEIITGFLDTESSEPVIDQETTESSQETTEPSPETTA